MLRIAQIALLFGLTSVSPAFAQYPAHILDAPFTANWSTDTTRNGTTTTYGGIIARTSDGSTYTTFSDSHFPGTGGIYRIEIDDLPNNRHITLYPDHSTYRYVLTSIGNPRTFSVQFIARMMQQLQNSYQQQPDRTKLDGQAHITALGQKQQNGLTLFGHKSEFTSTTGEKRTEEVWDSDLGIVITTKTVWPAEAKEQTTTVTDIRRIEPDSKLFEIPVGAHTNSISAPKLPN